MSDVLAQDAQQKSESVLLSERVTAQRIDVT